MRGDCNVESLKDPGGARAGVALQVTELRREPLAEFAGGLQGDDQSKGGSRPRKEGEDFRGRHGCGSGVDLLFPYI